MSKRLVRLNPDAVFSELGNVTGLEVNAVLRNGLTYFGKIKSVTSDYLVLSDARSHLHKIAISDLYEIIYDREEVRTSATVVI